MLARHFKDCMIGSLTQRIKLACIHSIKKVQSIMSLCYGHAVFHHAIRELSTSNCWACLAQEPLLGKAIQTSPSHELQAHDTPLLPTNLFTARPHATASILTVYSRHILQSCWVTVPRDWQCSGAITGKRSPAAVSALVTMPDGKTAQSDKWTQYRYTFFVLVFSSA